MPGLRTFVAKHPLSVYFALTYAISWGGFILVVGPGGFPGTREQFETLLPSVAWAMLAGPSVAALLLTGLLDGRAGLREVLSRLLAWRAGLRWYAVAILPAPILAAAGLLALSLTSPIFTSGDKATVLLSGIAAGLSTVLEELGWTGFAVPRLRLRHGIVGTGLIVGVVWGAWHFLQGLWVGDLYAGTVPPALFHPLSFGAGVAQLTAYRVLLVWVFDRTGSLLVTTLMHASLTASVIFIFRPEAAGGPYLAYSWLLAAALWIVVAAVVAAGGGRSARPPLTTP